MMRPLTGYVSQDFRMGLPELSCYETQSSHRRSSPSASVCSQTQSMNDASRKKKKVVTPRVLTGSIANAKTWIRSATFPVVYIIYGRLMCPMKVTLSQRQAPFITAEKCIFILHDQHEEKAKIRCTFYAVDREVPRFPVGAQLRVTGRAQTDGSLLVFSVRAENPGIALEALITNSCRGFQLGLSQ